MFLVRNFKVMCLLAITTINRNIDVLNSNIDKEVPDYEKELCKTFSKTKLI